MEKGRYRAMGDADERGGVMDIGKIKEQQANDLVSKYWDLLADIDQDFPLGPAYVLVKSYWDACWLLDRDPKSMEAIDIMGKSLILIKENISKDPLENIACVVTTTANFYRSAVTKDWRGWAE